MLGSGLKIFVDESDRFWRHNLHGEVLLDLLGDLEWIIRGDLSTYLAFIDILLIG